ncbi:MAG: ATP-binding protein [Paludibacter sp.]
MYRQDQLSEIIDLQTADFVHKSMGIERTALHNIPEVDNYATIITGIRRCGKSTLLLQLLNKKQDNAIYLNWEDIRLNGFETDDFIRLYSEIVKRKIKLLFFDEIQLVKNWEMFINQLLREEFKVFITGSNASLLSVELGTHLTGRQLSTELFPFSFEEFCNIKKLGLLPASVDLYLKNGGIPDYVKSEVTAVVLSLLDDILIRDIAIRYAIKDVETLKKLTIYLLSNISCPVSANKLTQSIGLKSASTVLEYFSYIKNAYLVDFISQFNYSFKVQLRNPKKVYAMDLGIVSAVTSSFSQDLGRKLENLVFLKLRSKYKEIFYFNEKGECDFLVKQQEKIIIAIQVCYQIDDLNFDREFNGLMDALNFFDLKEGTIVTHHQSDVFERNGRTVKLIPAHEFLMQKN